MMDEVHFESDGHTSVVRLVRSSARGGAGAPSDEARDEATEPAAVEEGADR